MRSMRKCICLFERFCNMQTTLSENNSSRTPMDTDYVPRCEKQLTHGHFQLPRCLWAMNYCMHSHGTAHLTHRRTISTISYYDRIFNASLHQSRIIVSVRARKCFLIWQMSRSCHLPLKLGLTSSRRDSFTRAPKRILRSFPSFSADAFEDVARFMHGIACVCFMFGVANKAFNPNEANCILLHKFNGRV